MKRILLLLVTLITVSLYAQDRNWTALEQLTQSIKKGSARLVSCTNSFNAENSRWFLY